VQCNQKLSESLTKNLSACLSGRAIVPGLNATADSFYSSQGRIYPSFNDQNTTLIDDLIKKHPDLVSLEMETFQLFELARASGGTISAAACTIVLAQRKSNEFLDHSSLHQLEEEAGKAVMDTIVSFPLKKVMDDDECVWNLIEKQKK